MIMYAMWYPGLVLDKKRNIKGKLVKCNATLEYRGIPMGNG